MTYFNFYFRLTKSLERGLSKTSYRAHCEHTHQSKIKIEMGGGLHSTLGWMHRSSATIDATRWVGRPGQPVSGAAPNRGMGH